MKKILLTAILLFVFVIIPVSAKVGVGVGTGKIEINQELKPGTIVSIPSIVVINTGDEKSFYEVNIDYKDDTPEMKPSNDWFIFEPQIFELNPGEQKTVNISIKLPVKGVQAGDYFAFVSASPVKILEQGRASVNVAAASRLYFTVGHANLFQAIIYRFSNFYANYHPWNTIVLALIFVASLIMIVKKKFKIQIAKK